jgi:hypothetical protein
LLPAIASNASRRWLLEMAQGKPKGLKGLKLKVKKKTFHSFWQNLRMSTGADERGYWCSVRWS